MTRVLFLLLFLPPVLQSAAFGVESVSGILYGKQEITLKAKSQGEITEMRAHEGDIIHVGDVLAVIDDKQETIELNMAQVDFQSAETSYERTKKLRKFVSREELDDKETAFKTKRSILDLKTLAFANTRILSIIEGQIAKRYFNPGDTVALGDKVFDVVQMQELVLRVNVPAHLTTGMAPGSTIRFTTDLYKDRFFSATLTQVSPVIDAPSGTVRIHLLVKNQKLESGSYELKPGMVVTLDLKSLSLPLGPSPTPTPVPAPSPYGPNPESPLDTPPTLTPPTHGNSPAAKR